MERRRRRRRRRRRLRGVGAGFGATTLLVIALASVSALLPLPRALGVDGVGGGAGGGSEEAGGRVVPGPASACGIVGVHGVDDDSDGRDGSSVVRSSCDATGDAADAATLTGSSRRGGIVTKEKVENKERNKTGGPKVVSGQLWSGGRSGGTAATATRATTGGADDTMARPRDAAATATATTATAAAAAAATATATTTAQSHGTESPTIPAAEYAALGGKLLNARETTDAIRILREGVELYPTDIVINLNLAFAMVHQGKWEDAVGAFRRVVELTEETRHSPHIILRARAMTWVGVSMMRMEKNKKDGKGGGKGREEEAIQWMERSVTYHPIHEGRQKLAEAYRDVGRYVDAAKQSALAIAMPGGMKGVKADDDYLTLSTALSALACWDLLAHVLDHCLEGGGCSLQSSKYSPYQIHLQYAVALRQGGSVNVAKDGGGDDGTTMALQRRQEAATEHLEKAAKLAGKDAERIDALAKSYLFLAKNRRKEVDASLLDSDGEYPTEEVLGDLTRALRPILGPSAKKTPAWSVVQSRHVEAFAWPIPEELVRDAKSEMDEQKAIFASGGTPRDVVEPYRCFLVPVYDLEDCIFAARVRNREILQSFPESVRAMKADDFHRDEFPRITSFNATNEAPPLHVGMFSADVRAHPMQALLRAFAKLRPPGTTRVTLYHVGADAQVLSEFRGHVDEDVACETHDYAKCLNHARTNQVHVWLEMTGPTGHGIPELGAAGPAPVGVLWAGFPGSLADPALPYLVADRYTVPPESRAASAYPENMIYVPGSWFIASPGELPPNVTREDVRSRYDIPMDAVVYSYFGRIGKLDNVTFQSWCDIVGQVPNSYLVMQKRHGEGTSQIAVIKNIRASWDENGLPSERLVFVPPFQWGEHIQVMKGLSDVALDTSMYVGGTTSYDAIFAGLPLVHRPGGWKMMQRAGGSILVAAGLGDVLICDSVDDYVQVAVRLGLDEDFYRKIKQRISDAIEGRDNKAVLFRPKVGVAALVDGLRQAYALWREGQSPGTIFSDEGPNVPKT